MLTFRLAAAEIPIKGFFDLAERDQGYVIMGAAFLVGLAIVLIVFCTDMHRSRQSRRKSPQSNIL